MREEFKYDPATRKLFFRALAYMGTNIKLPSDLHSVYDKRFMYIEKGKFWSLFPMIRPVLLDHLKNCSDVVEDMVKTYLSLGETGTGYPIEFYIIIILGNSTAGIKSSS